MPRLMDRRTGKQLGTFTEEECTEPTRYEEPYPIAPDLVERFIESGASGRDFDLGIEPDLH